MFGIGLLEIIILAGLVLGAVAIVAIVLNNNSSRAAGRDRPHGDRPRHFLPKLRQPIERAILREDNPSAPRSGVVVRPLTGGCADV
jgi:hypothetical protein